MTFYEAEEALLRGARQVGRLAWEPGIGGPGGFLTKVGMYFYRHRADFSRWSNWFPSREDLAAVDWRVLS